MEKVIASWESAAETVSLGVLTKILVVLAIFQACIMAYVFFGIYAIKPWRLRKRNLAEGKSSLIQHFGVLKREFHPTGEAQRNGNDDGDKSPDAEADSNV